MMRVLLSVSNKTGLVDLGRGLITRGAELVSTGGTERALINAGLPVTAVSKVTGFPEMTVALKRFTLRSMRES